jgi:uncharacterized protein (TIGR03435 family)
LRKALGLLILTVLVVGLARGQGVPPESAFSVASLKRAPDARPTGWTETDESVRFTGPLLLIVARAYDVTYIGCLVEPSWLTSEFYVLSAKLPEGSTKEQIPAMLRQLLAERLHFAAHRENRDSPIYALVVDKGGLKLQRPQVDASVTTTSGRQFPFTAGYFAGTVHLNGRASLAKMAEMISPEMGRRVVDMTGTEGEFEIHLDAALPNVAADAEPAKEITLPNGTKLSSDAPSIFNAIQKLGLRLEPRRAPLEYVVVDAVEKDPTEN